MLEIVLCAPDNTDHPSTSVDRIRSLDRVRRLKYWQWLLVCESLPTVLVRLVVILWFYLTDGWVIDMCPA